MIMKSPFYPYFSSYKGYFKHKFFLGIGSNIDPIKNLNRFFAKFKKDRRFHIVENSIILKNKAFGYTNQPDFLNAVMLVETSLCPNKTLKILNHYEKIFKRVRSFKNAPRTLDLDILDFDKKISYNKSLILPHLGIDSRLSVIIPMGLMKEFK